MRLPVVVPNQVEFLGARARNEPWNSRSKMLAEKLRGQDRRVPSLRIERRRSTLRRRSKGVPRRPAWLRPLLCTYSFATLRSLILRDADANNGGFPLLRVLTSLTVQTNSPYSIVYTSLLIVDRRITGPTVGTPWVHPTRRSGTSDSISLDLTKENIRSILQSTSGHRSGSCPIMRIVSESWKMSDLTGLLQRPRCTLL